MLARILSSYAGTLRDGTPAGVPLMLLSRILAAGLAFLISVVTARLLDVDGRGQYFLLVSYAQLAAQLATLGLQSSNLAVHAARTAQMPVLVIGSAGVSLGSGLLAALLILLVGQHLDPANAGWEGTAITAVLAFAVCSAFVQMALPLLVAEGRHAAFSCFTVAIPLVALPLVALAGLRTGSPAKTFAANTLGTVAVAVLLIIYAARAVGLRTIVSGLRAIAEGRGFAFRTFVVTGCGWLAQRVYVFVLGKVSTDFEVGCFSIASQVLDTAMIVPITIASVVFPRLLRNDPRLDLRRTLFATLGGMLLLVLVLAAAAPFLIPLVFGSAFAAAVPALWAVLPSVLLLSAITVVSQAVSARSQPMIAAAAWTAGAVVGAVACIWLGGRFGAVGAGISQAVALLVVLYLLERIRRDK